MERLSICMICGKKPGMYSCTMCGTLVCESCFDRGKGVCIGCAQGRRS